MPSRPGGSLMSRFHFATVRRMAATSLLFVAGLPSALAYNTQDVINFSVTGNIVAGSCNVSYPATVELGTLSANGFLLMKAIARTMSRSLSLSLTVLPR